MKLFSENIYMLFFLDTLSLKQYNINVNKIRKLVNNMSDKELLQTIQNDIKNIDECIEMCDTEEGVDYLKSIQQNLREQEIKLIKKMSIEKAIKEH